MSLADEIPIPNRLVEGNRSIKQASHPSNRREIPTPNRLVEGNRSLEHPVHHGNVAHVPATNVLIESGSIHEGFGHVRYLRNIPIADVSVSEDSGDSVTEPEVILKIGIGDQFVGHEFRPVVGPVWV